MKTPDSISKARQKLWQVIGLWEQKQRELPSNQGLMFVEREEINRKLLFIKAEIAKLKADADKLRRGSPAQRLAGFATTG